MTRSLVCDQNEDYEAWLSHHCYHCGRVFGESDPTPGCICWTELDDERIEDLDDPTVEPAPDNLTTPYEDFLADQIPEVRITI
jgi:hypothetical protein